MSSREAGPLNEGFGPSSSLNSAGDKRGSGGLPSYLVTPRIRLASAQHGDVEPEQREGGGSEELPPVLPVEVHRQQYLSPPRSPTSSLALLLPVWLPAKLLFAPSSTQGDAMPGGARRRRRRRRSARGYTAWLRPTSSWSSSTSGPPREVTSGSPWAGFLRRLFSIWKCMDEKRFCPRRHNRNPFHAGGSQMEPSKSSLNRISSVLDRNPREWFTRECIYVAMKITPSAASISVLTHPIFLSAVSLPFYMFSDPSEECSRDW